MRKLHAVVLASVLALPGAATAHQDDAGPIVALGFDGSSHISDAPVPNKFASF